FFGGAGVSTESGIPDFRSRDGLYNLSYDYPPETILSHSFYLRFPDVFWRFYREKVLVPALAAKPNAAHEALARLEADGHLSAIVTQNIDGLHQKAGSNRVLELHGSIHRNYCESCHAFYPAEAVLKLLEKDEIPRCTRPGCKGHIKPDVVLYEEQLNGDILDAAIESISAAEVMLIGGTSLVVNPAAGLVGLFSGKPLAVINRDETTSDHNADLLFRENIGRVLGELYR
ncbi:MAG TPA: NAD-dependent protein deacylase, partial [Coriobacteriia bacterium]|nr:NAD-dependent protein deacylase [Coriobacteriia bacterium]